LMFARTLGPEAVIVAFDIDDDCIRRAQTVLNELACKTIFVRENFSKVAEKLNELNIDKVDFILADLGVCSAQLDNVEKGLSFQKNMPLDMRLDNRLKITAADIVNKTDEKELADIIYNFGQDRAARRIARFIVQHRKSQRITTTAALATIVCRALGIPQTGRKNKIHPATRTFQALRIAVNDELGALQKLLDSAPDLLKPNGYIAIISFHSLEDRLVKLNFKQNAKEEIYKILTKKPIIPTEQEISANPRARSSKLRIAQRTTL